MQYISHMHNKEPIQNIANIVTGYTFRGAIKEFRNSGLFVLQSRNINNALYIAEDTLIETKDDISHSKAFAKDRDVVIGTRGFFKAAVLKSSKRIIASSSVYLFRIKPSKNCLPEYLSIYLNSPIGQRNLLSLSTSSAIRHIKKKDLESISVPLLPLDQQQKIVDLFNNIKEQEKILKRKNEVHKQILNATFQEMVRS